VFNYLLVPGLANKLTPGTTFELLAVAT